ncbi:MAG: hypothetical protein E7I13_04865 [Negativicoccus succinicivorans]|nr:hypothetical protein [Negativicoccus succinicivorans]
MAFKELQVTPIYRLVTGGKALSVTAASDQHVARVAEGTRMRIGFT